MADDIDPFTPAEERRSRWFWRRFVDEVPGSVAKWAVPAVAALVLSLGVFVVKALLDLAPRSSPPSVGIESPRSGQEQKPPTSSVKLESKVPGVGDAIESDNYRLTLDGVDCSVDVPAATPTGKFCATRMRLLNKSNDASVPIVGWRLWVGSGRYPEEHENLSSKRTIFLNSEVSFVVLFDVPVEVKPTGLEADFFDGRPFRWGF